MTASAPRYTFGPVPSRRLGKSLGINNIPAKVCTYACVYCQVGRTLDMRKDRSAFYEPEDILRDVDTRITAAVKKSEAVDYLAFVPDGEPTLDINLGKTISLLKPLGVPVAVITNASLLDRKDVREDLYQADWVSLKIDAAREATWRRIDHPHGALQLSSVQEGMLRFAEDFTGRLVTETMIVRGINDTRECMESVADFLGKLQPHTAYLSIPTRPPAEKRACAPEESVLVETFQRFARRVENVEYLVGYEGDAFASTGDVTQDILSITAVHPMRDRAVDAFLKRTGSSWSIVDKLVSRGDLLRTEHNGQIFYLRRFPKYPDN